MKPRFIGLTVAGLATLAVAACSDATSSASPLTTAALSAALGSVPIGFGDLTTSFVGASADDAPLAGLWLGGGRDARFDHGDFMGGGIQDAFIGGVAFAGRGGGRGPFGGPFAGGRGCADSTVDRGERSSRLSRPDAQRHHGEALDAVQGRRRQRAAGVRHAHDEQREHGVVDVRDDHLRPRSGQPGDDDHDGNRGRGEHASGAAAAARADYSSATRRAC